MKLTVDKAQILPALEAASRVADPKSTMPILANVLLRAGRNLEIAATNLDQTVTATADCKVTEPGAITVPAKRLLEVVAGIPGDEIAMKALDIHFLEIRAGKAAYKIPGLAADDFPKLPQQPEHWQPCPPAPLAWLLRHVQHAILVDDVSRPHLSGALFESAKDGRARAVATNGHVMGVALADLGSVAIPVPVLLPARAVKEILRLISAAEAIDVGFSSGEIHIRRGALVLTCRASGAQFPPWNQVIPKSHETRVTSNVAAIAEAAQRVGAVVEIEDMNGVVFAFRDGECLISAEGKVSAGAGEETVECRIEGPAVTIGCLARYFRDAAACVDTGELVIEMGSPLDPIAIRAVGLDTFIGIVMPIRL